MERILAALAGLPVRAIVTLGPARVVARGAGLRVLADAPPERLREAIQRVVTDPAFQHAAQQLATE
jgi:UDP:flavonoid glycosyltransferase YjiC (YdhE family)